MRFVKSEKSPYVLRLVKTNMKCPIESFNEQCFAISLKLKTIREMIDQSEFPSREFKELIEMLENLKQHDIPQIIIPYTALNVLEKEKIQKFFEDELEKQTKDLLTKSATKDRQNKYLEELEEKDLNLK